MDWLRSPELVLGVMIALTGALGSFFAVKFGQSEHERLLKALQRPDCTDADRAFTTYQRSPNFHRRRNRLFDSSD